jgi:TatD DNase family protein
MSLIDSHCHLDDKQFRRDREAVIQRALEAGVEAMLAVGSGPPDLEAGIRLAEAWPQIYATVGVHPHDAAKANEDTWKRLAELLRHPKVLAVGEIGLDYHYDFSPRPAQREAFVRQLEAARAAGKPVVIHTREAWPATLEILKEHWSPGGLPGIMHCFSGGPLEVIQVVELGFYVSFAGVLTYPKAVGLHQAARRAPLERLLVETEAPYLAPEPHRGRRSEPAFVVETARRLAELRGESFEKVATATTENFRRLFGLGGSADLPVAGPNG